MIESEQTQSSLGTNDVSSARETRSEFRNFLGKRCAQCGGPFGPIRHRRAGKQFCSARCVDDRAEMVRNAVAARARWLEFLYQRR